MDFFVYLSFLISIAFIHDPISTTSFVATTIWTMGYTASIFYAIHMVHTHVAFPFNVYATIAYIWLCMS